ncbi:MAG: peptidylprolyl isomerase [Spirochaetia bacterium]
MKALQGKQVSIHYSMGNAGGTILETSKDKGPLVYIHGTGSLLPALEEAIEGKSQGDEFSLVLDPSQAYGERDEELVTKVPYESIPENLRKPGATLKVTSESGARKVNIIAVQDDGIIVDANHPLAGLSLFFDVEVIDVCDP